MTHCLPSNPTEKWSKAAVELWVRQRLPHSNGVDHSNCHHYCGHRRTGRASSSHQRCCGAVEEGGLLVAHSVTPYVPPTVAELPEVSRPVVEQSPAQDAVFHGRRTGYPLCDFLELSDCADAASDIPLTDTPRATLFIDGPLPGSYSPPDSATTQGCSPGYTTSPGGSSPTIAVLKEDGVGEARGPGPHHRDDLSHISPTSPSTLTDENLKMLRSRESSLAAAKDLNCNDVKDTSGSLKESNPNEHKRRFPEDATEVLEACCLALSHSEGKALLPDQNEKPCLQSLPVSSEWENSSSSSPLSDDVKPKAFGDAAEGFTTDRLITDRDKSEATSGSQLNKKIEMGKGNSQSPVPQPLTGTSKLQISSFDGGLPSNSEAAQNCAFQGTKAEVLLQDSVSQVTPVVPSETGDSSQGKSDLHREAMPSSNQPSGLSQRRPHDGLDLDGDKLTAESFRLAPCFPKEAESPQPRSPVASENGSDFRRDGSGQTPFGAKPLFHQPRGVRVAALKGRSTQGATAKGEEATAKRVQRPSRSAGGRGAPTLRGGFKQGQPSTTQPRKVSGPKISPVHPGIPALLVSTASDIITDDLDQRKQKKNLQHLPVTSRPLRYLREHYFPNSQPRSRSAVPSFTRGTRKNPVVKSTGSWVTRLYPGPTARALAPRRESRERSGSLPWVMNGGDWIWMLGAEGATQGDPSGPLRGPLEGEACQAVNTASCWQVSLPKAMFGSALQDSRLAPQVLRNQHKIKPDHPARVISSLPQVPESAPSAFVFNHEPVQLPPWIPYGPAGWVWVLGQGQSFSQWWSS